MIAEALTLPFFQRALLAALLASIACGVIGTFVVVKQMSSISGGLSHAAFGGVGLGFFLGFSPLVGATGFSLVCGLLIGWVYLHRQQSLDTFISILWSAGMALGIFLVALTPGYAPDLNSYLFGSILFVPVEYMLLIAALDIVIVTFVWSLFKELQAVSFDEEFSLVIGAPVTAVILLLLSLTALTVVVLSKVVGTILTIALLTTPAVIARHWSAHLRKMVILASGISALCSIGGMFGAYWLSEALDVRAPTGPLIILFSTGLYVMSHLARTLAVHRAGN